MSRRMPAIGIDLGTTHACVGVWRAGKVDIIPNIQGNRTTPTCVSFTKTVRHFGEAAVNQAGKDPVNAVFHSKRLIGVSLAHVTADVKQALEGLINHWQFGVKELDNKLKVAVEYQEKKRLFRLEEISAMVLRNLKETAETFLGGIVSDAVISVPASFNDSQRQATLDAGKIAGLNVLSIINEPTAAALAYGLDKPITGRNILIFDLGAGKLDVTIVTVPSNNMIEVKSTAGNPRLGGEDIDNRLVDYLVEEFRKKEGKDVRTKPRSLRRLKTAAERAKRNFSTSSEVFINIDALMDDIDFSVTLTRDWFNEYCSDLFASTLDTVKSALEGAKLEKSQINDILLVGGSTGILKIRNLLEEFFGMKLDRTINSDEAVACGAAIYAAVLSGDGNLQDVVVKDVTSLSINIQDSNKMSFWIKQCLVIPTTENVTFPLSKEFPTSGVQVIVWEGVNEVAKSLALSASVASRSSQREEYDFLKVSVCIDANGIMSLCCFATRGKTKTAMDVTVIKDTISSAELESLKSASIEMGVKDRQYLDRVKARVELESYVFTVRSQSDGSSMSQEFKTHISSKCNKMTKWLEQNQHATTEHFVQMKEKLETEFKKTCKLATEQDELNRTILDLENYLSTVESQVPGLTKYRGGMIYTLYHKVSEWLGIHKQSPNQPLKKEDVDKKRQELEAAIKHYKQQNELNQKNHEIARDVLEKFVQLVEFEASERNISQDMKTAILNKCEEVKLWRETNEQVNVDEFHMRQNELEVMLANYKQQYAKKETERPVVNPQTTERPVVNPQPTETPVVNPQPTEGPVVNQQTTERHVVYQQPMKNDNEKIQSINRERARKDLEKYVASLRNTIVGCNMPQEKKRALWIKCDTTSKWLHEHQQATKEEYELEMEELEKAYELAAAQNIQNETQLQNRQQARIDFENYLDQVNAASDGSTLPHEIKTVFRAKCDTTSKWLREHQQATKEEYELEMEGLKTAYELAVTQNIPREAQNREEAREDLENYVRSVKAAFVGWKMTLERRKALWLKCDATFRWLAGNRQAGQEEFARMKKELEQCVEQNASEYRLQRDVLFTDSRRLAVSAKLDDRNQSELE